ncbi:hypothetical protein [Actinoplanes sp. NPDC049599]|uniref:hypothetical protein n=1 Tax=Actinoplanes sp. NPDC049599 TaxID=3363903 RepID=UPI003790E51B
MNRTEPVTFLVPKWRPALNVALILLAVMLLFRGLLLVAGGAAGFSLDVSDYVEAVLFAVLTAAAGAAGAMVGIGRSPGWVRLSEAGLEFAAARHRAIFLPWTAVAAVRLRLRRRPN